MTFSIIARCKDSGQFGGAVSSSSPAVASRCLHARSGVGVAMSQNITDPTLGTQLLDAMAQGDSPETAVEQLVKQKSYIQYRQLVALNGNDNAVVFSGEHILGVFGHAVGDDAAAAGNLLDNKDVPQAMITAFEQAEGALAERLLAAMHAAIAAGGEAGPVHSAGLMVMDKDVSWPVVDLRIDWSDTPIEDLQTAWDVYQPQLNDYVTRAVNPTVAPSYGVPGDE